MDTKQNFQIIITATAERAYFEVLNYVFEHHSPERSNAIALELLDYPNILSVQPNIGTIEKLFTRKEIYRFLVYQRTKNITIKIIYYVDEQTKTVYITDFFPSEMFPEKMNERI